MGFELYRKNFQKKNDVMVIGHRGACKEAFENTIRSFELAMDAGADMIEFDLFKTIDNHVVVLHEPTTIRISDQNIRVKKSTLQQVKEITLKDGSKIPTLEEVFAQFKGKLSFQIEIIQSKIATEVLELIDKYDVYDQCLISSFNHNQLPKYKRSQNPVPIALLNDVSDNVLKNTLEMGLDGIHLEHTVITPELVNEAHKNNLFMNAWTVDTSEDWERMITYGVDGIITDYPRELCKFLKSR
jgi:glycerophosphoryl diester phosphodiesterase